MTGSKALTDEQVSVAKEILKKLPSKKQMNAQLESAMRLKTAFRKTKQKGYTPKEIREYLREGGIEIPAYIIVRVLREMKVLKKEEGDSQIEKSREDNMRSASEKMLTDNHSFIEDNDFFHQTNKGD